MKVIDLLKTSGRSNYITHIELCERGISEKFMKNNGWGVDELTKQKRMHPFYNVSNNYRNFLYFEDLIQKNIIPLAFLNLEIAFEGWNLVIEKNRVILFIYVFEKSN